MPLSATVTQHIFDAKSRAGLNFTELGELIGRSEVSTASIFYGQTRASLADISALASALSVPEETLAELNNYPDRGHGVEMPPKEPLIYRLYEIVQNYGQAYKAIINEKFGDGIMSAIAFSSQVEREVEGDGSEWVVITMRGKWLPYKRF